MSLSVKEQAFVAAYLENGGNGTAAAKAAGYSAATAAQCASRLLKRAHVAAELEARQTAALNKAVREVGKSKADVLNDLERRGQKAEEAEQYGAAIRASELQGKEMGMFAERHVLALEDDRRKLLAAVEPEGPEVYQRVLARLAAGEKALPSGGG